MILTDVQFFEFKREQFKCWLDTQWHTTPFEYTSHSMMAAGLSKMQRGIDLKIAVYQNGIQPLNWSSNQIVEALVQTHLQLRPPLQTLSARGWEKIKSFI